jgi:hypothetical protein
MESASPILQKYLCAKAWPVLPLQFAFNMKRKYNCMYRKAQFKKHKTWDNDGYLIVDENHWTLMDESGKEVLRCSAKPISPECGVEIRIAGIEVQLGSVESTMSDIVTQPKPVTSPSVSAPNMPLEAGFYRIHYRSIFKKVSLH